MTTHNPTYKLTKKMSVEREFEDEEDPFPFGRTFSKHPQFYTEKNISIRHNKRGLPNDENGRVKFPSGMQFLHEEALSVLDEHQMLEYSSTDQLSEISHTLAGLGARSGHSFEKQNLEFSLSSEVQDVEHENRALRKKMNEMKKELKEYRELDDKMVTQIKAFRDKAEQEEAKAKTYKQEVQLLNSRKAELEEELEAKEGRIEELQRLLASKERRLTEGKVSIMVEEVENYKEVILQYEQERQHLKNSHEKELFDNEKKYTTMIQELHRQFESAKVIGQRQINDLLAEVHQKTQENCKLRNKIAHYDFKCRMSTLVSDNFSRKGTNDPKSYSPNKYALRFAKFSQFIEERIHKSCEKDLKVPTPRASKSAVQNQVFPSNLNDFREKVPNSPESPSSMERDRKFQIAGLFSAKQKLRKHVHQP